MDLPYPDHLLAATALESLLQAFRTHSSLTRHQEQDLLRHNLTPLNHDWDLAHPGFPKTPLPHASARGILYRGRRDAYLRTLILRLLNPQLNHSPSPIVVNPACVFGFHARRLATSMPSAQVIATDLNPAFNAWRSHWPFSPAPPNYQFQRDDLFQPRLVVRPAAVVFFGACGSLTDAAIDYAVRLNTRYLICRACCHDNIGGNTSITHRWTPLNAAFRLKNSIFASLRDRRTGEYFSDRYTRHSYPRSTTARQLSSPDEFHTLSRNSVDSDLCRSLIDLDRALRLIEDGYRVWYRSELFVAQRRDPPPKPPSGS